MDGQPVVVLVLYLCVTPDVMLIKRGDFSVLNIGDILDATVELVATNLTLELLVVQKDYEVGTRLKRVILISQGGIERYV